MQKEIILARLLHLLLSILNLDQRRRAEIGFCLGLKQFYVNMVVLCVEWLVFMTLFLMIMTIFTMLGVLYMPKKLSGLPPKRLKYGVQVPCTVKEAISFDSENNNTLWQDAMKKEM
jgi:hypothetical protein